MNHQQIILHVDLNSFFATAEQQTNPSLRGKPVGITKGKGRACIIAASVEAKKRGVKTGSNVYEAKQLCPNIILIPADFDRYADISYRFIAICKSYSPQCEVFSLDECFIDVTETEQFWREENCHSEQREESLNISNKMLRFAQHDNGEELNHLAWLEMWKSLRGVAGIGVINIAFEIKRRLREEVGDYMSCSVGISHNRMLAKLASGQIKWDGLFWITEENKLTVLDRSNLTDVCGLGYGLHNHLARLGIITFPQLRNCSLEFLYKHFGPYWSVHLYDVARGNDTSIVNSFTALEDAKSVGRTYTTHRLLTTNAEIRQLARNLCEEAAAKARKMNLVGRYVGFMIRGQESHPRGEVEATSGAHPGGVISGWLANRSPALPDEGWYGHRTLKNYIDDGKTFFDICMQILNNWDVCSVRFCGVTLGMLTRKDYLSTPLFPSDQRRIDLIKSVDHVNEKYGTYTVFPGQLLGMPIVRPEVNGYFGDKKYRLEFVQKP